MKFGKLLSTLLASCLTLSVAAFSITASAKDHKQIEWPELAAEAPVVSNVAGAKMKCFVDTPAWDYFTYNYCLNDGIARTTSAVFEIEGGPASNFKVIWSNSNCSQTSKTCFLPIRQYQTIKLSADILDLTNGTFSSVSATAHYEGYN